MSNTADTPDSPPTRGVALEIAEEVLSVETRRRSAGKVRVATTTETIEEMARAALEAVDVDVTRVPVDRVVERAPEVRVEGDTTIVPVVEEILVVEKRLVLREEIHVRRRVRTTLVEEPVTLRRQSATVERLDAEGDPVAERDAGVDQTR